MTKRKLSATEVAGFCEQLAMILKAGIYLGEGLDMMAQDNARTEDQQTLTQLKEELERSGSLAPALEAAEILQQAAHRAVFGESIVTDEYRCSSVGVTQKK